MTKLFTYLLAIVVFLETGALVVTNSRAAWRNQEAFTELTLDGAFRDGLYLGRLSAERGRAQQPPSGRWSTEKDRASFAAGYRRGYNDSLASAAPNGQNRAQ